MVGKTDSNTRPSHRVSWTPAEDYSRVSTATRRHTVVSPSRHRPLRMSAIYAATHPSGTEDEAGAGAADAVPGTVSDNVLDVHSASMRRAARELLGGTRRRNTLVIDLSTDYQRRPFPSRGSSIGDSSTGSNGSADEEVEQVNELEDDKRGDVFLDTKTSDTEVGVPITGGFTTGNGDETTPLVSPKADRHRRGSHRHRHDPRHDVPGMVSSFIQQTSAVAVVVLLNIMISIPFGVSYFPIGWRAVNGSNATAADDSGGEADMDEDNGPFPLPGKEALGIRMFLFATIMGQIALTFASKFENPIGLQMVENVPFLHALCHTVIQNQGYGKEALSTVFFLFGLSSVLVGTTFYLLGKWKLGSIVYFFPNHVLVGCIGGIGVFLIVTAVEVTSDKTFTFDMDGVRGVFVDRFHLISVVLGFEFVLRCLQHVTKDKHGNAMYTLLSPVYYCLITPLFYLGLYVFGVTIQQASEQGYFFPTIVSDDGGADSSSTTSIWQDPHLWDIFRIIHLPDISWVAAFQSTGTMIALAAFSLIHVPINIPAFAISTDVDTDMNAELIAHGYANALSGMFGGLQNYMTYSNSVLYAKSGGKGRISSLAVIVGTSVLFVIGPSIVSYLPRCMAGTLLLHIGIDLALEGVYDSFGNYDNLEYAGIWAITLVMTIWGMTAALIAGVIAALTTYAVQSINYQNPIRQVLTASTLRSSAWTRCVQSREILENDTTGRARILIFQLQGHLFFGNVAKLTDTIKTVLKEKRDFDESPIVVIVDFTLVVGMDSSAAHAVAKLKKIIHRLFQVEVSIFVTGSGRGGFPCEFALTEALFPEAAHQIADAGLDYNELIASMDPSSTTSEATAGGGGIAAAAAAMAANQNMPHLGSSSTPSSSLSQQHVQAVLRGSISLSRGSIAIGATKKLTPQVDGRVCESLDDALRFAEDILIAREDPSLECSSYFNNEELLESDSAAANLNMMTLDEEKAHAKKYFRELLPKSTPDMEKIIDILWSSMKREEFFQDEALWESGDESDSMKLLICGELVSIIEDTLAFESVKRGNIVGELGLVHGTKRLTTLLCASEKAVLYSLSKSDFETLRRKKPQVTAAIDGVVIRYLAHRVQHVSNRYFHTTLPV